MNELLLKYKDLVLQFNASLNLISGTTTPMEFDIKHIEDSLRITEHIALQGALLDIGSGAGLPGIPLAINNRDLQVTLLDATLKKIEILNSIIKSLELTNIVTIHGRCEELAHLDDFREHFDCVTARAVAKLPTLLEFALPFVKVGGIFLAYKGRDYKDELAQSKTAFETLGATLENVHPYTLHNSMGEHVYLIFRKVSPTPLQYPRRTGIPQKRPIA